MQLFYSKDISLSGFCTLDAEESRHAVRVLRMREGDIINVTDGRGNLYRCRILQANDRACVVEVAEQEFSISNSQFSIHLAVAPTKNPARMEWLVEKAVEIGVGEITLLQCDHSERTFLKTDRLEKLAVSAMKQSLHLTLPPINPAVSLHDWLNSQFSILNSQFKASVDAEKRQATACNHSATHLMHYALRQVLGEHVEQKGSSVDAQRLRFDFSHFAKLSQEEIRDVERRVNRMIRQCLPLEEHRAMPIAEAQKLGAMALFGEKYGDKVRVVKYGPSVEFCGGTHVANTGMIGSFRIVSEGAVAAGMRRIEAITAEAATAYADCQQEQIMALTDMFKGTKDLAASIAKLQEENTQMKAAVEQMQKMKALDVARSYAARLADSPIVVERISDDVNTLKDALIALRGEHPDMAMVLGSVKDGKPALLIVLGENRVAAGLNAGLMVRTLGKEIQGGGGGQPHFATAGGKNPDGLDKALAMAKDLIK